MQIRARGLDGHWYTGYLIMQEICAEKGKENEPAAYILTSIRANYLKAGQPVPFSMQVIDPQTIQYPTGIESENGWIIHTGDYIQTKDEGFIGLVSAERAPNSTVEFMVQWHKLSSKGQLIACGKQRLSEMWTGDGVPTVIGNIWDKPRCLLS